MTSEGFIIKGKVRDDPVDILVELVCADCRAGPYQFFMVNRGLTEVVVLDR